MKEKIHVSIIAKAMNIRAKRLEIKIDKLGLELDEFELLSKQDAIALIMHYVKSLKTSLDTKNRANIFLDQLKSNNFSPKSIEKESKKVSTKVEPTTMDKGNVIWYRKAVIEFTDFCQTIFDPLKKLVQKTVISSVQILESLYFKFIALMVAISVQMHHSAHWFYRVSPDENPSWAAALGYAFMVDLFILVVTMEGKLSIAKTFAVLTFLANVLYFQFWVGFDGTVQAYSNAVSSVLISSIMAYIIYAYTELFVRYKKTGNQ